MARRNVDRSEIEDVGRSATGEVRSDWLADVVMEIFDAFNLGPRFSDIDRNHSIIFV
jgi:hypothetical protein